MSEFNLLALISAGKVTEDDNILGIMQNISQEHAHQIARRLVLATGQPAHLRLIGTGEIEEIEYTPEQVDAIIRKPEKS